MKEKPRRKLSSLIVIFVALAVVISSTLAWFFMDDELEFNRTYDLSNFSADAEVYFLYNSAETPLSAAYKNTDETIRLSYVNTDVNYIGNLRVKVKFKGRGDALMRLKMVHQWKDGTGKILSYNVQIPYLINNKYLNTDTGNLQKWFDNRRDDYCLYYASPISTASNLTENVQIVINGTEPSIANLISSMAGTSLSVSIEFSAVQIERYPQFWGLTNLPWPGATIVG